MKNKVETITINLRVDHAYALASFLGIQGIEDTRKIIEKYKLNMNEYEMEDILQHLYDQLYCELELEM